MSLISLIQFLTIILDLLGLILVGGIVAVTTAAVQGTQLPKAVQNLVSFFNLHEALPQTIAAYLGITAAVFLIVKSFLSYYFSLRSFSFLARREAEISKGLAEKIFTQDIIALDKFSTSQYQHVLTNGCSSVMSGVIGQSLSLFAEVALQFLMLITLLFFSPVLTLSCLLFFFSLFFVLNRFQGENATKWGRGMTFANVSTTRSIADALGSYREALVSGRRNYFIEKISKSRSEVVDFQVRKLMLAQFSKYAFEISIIVAGLGITAFAFMSGPALEAASLIAIFLTAAMRIAPSVLKLQQGLIQLRGAAGATELFFEINTQVSEYIAPKSVMNVDISYPLDQSLAISLFEVSFTYPNNKTPALENISLDIPVNKSFAIVGPSGAGKSTLVDVILGVIAPQRGEVKVFGQQPKAWNSNTGRIAYVPQSVYLLSGSIKENIALGINPENIDVKKCWQVLEQVNLKTWVESLENGIDSEVRERGSKMSGGQRQRVGIARALYQDPFLMVLDEATSALDAESEFEISKSIHSMKNSVTTIVIAHRLSTVKNSDSVIYLDNGKLIAQGSFNELRDLIPNFDRQAHLMGIGR